MIPLRTVLIHTRKINHLSVSLISWRPDIDKRYAVHVATHHTTPHHITQTIEHATHLHPTLNIQVNWISISISGFYSSYPSNTRHGTHHMLPLLCFRHYLLFFILFLINIERKKEEEIWMRVMVFFQCPPGLSGCQVQTSAQAFLPGQDPRDWQIGTDLRQRQR